MHCLRSPWKTLWAQPELCYGWVQRVGGPENCWLDYPWFLLSSGFPGTEPLRRKSVCCTSWTLLRKMIPIFSGRDGSPEIHCLLSLYLVCQGLWEPLTICPPSANGPLFQDHLLFGKRRILICSIKCSIPGCKLPSCIGLFSPADFFRGKWKRNVSMSSLELWQTGRLRVHFVELFFCFYDQVPKEQGRTVCNWKIVSPAKGHFQHYSWAFR